MSREALGPRRSLGRRNTVAKYKITNQEKDQSPCIGKTHLETRVTFTALETRQRGGSSPLEGDNGEEETEAKGEQEEQDVARSKVELTGCPSFPGGPCGPGGPACPPFPLPGGPGGPGGPGSPGSPFCPQAICRDSRNQASTWIFDAAVMKECPLTSSDADAEVRSVDTDLTGSRQEPVNKCLNRTDSRTSRKC